MGRFKDELAHQLSLAMQQDGDFQFTLNTNDPAEREIEQKLNFLLEKMWQAKQEESKRKKIEAQYKKAQWFFHSIVNNIPIMLFIKDAKELKMQLWNKAGEELVGIPRKEFLGKTDYDFFPEEQAAFFQQKDREVLSRKIQVALEEPIQTRHGDRWLYTKKIPLLDQEGTPKYLLGISEDITERRETEVILRKAKESAEAANRAKSEFLANISHELRTPLTLILGPVEGMLTQKNLSKEERYSLEVVSRNAYILKKHVDDLLDIAKLEAKELRLSYTKIDLSQLIARVISYFDALVTERNISVSLEIPSQIFLEIDADKLERIFLNLFSNALKFTPDQGKIRCALQVAPEENPESVKLLLADSGPGVPLSLRETIFERFRQGEEGNARRFGGTGLGLAIVKEFIVLHKGSISVEDAPEGGALFVVTLPLLAPPDVLVHKYKSEPENAPKRPPIETVSLVPQKDILVTPGDTPLLLIIEDNPEMSNFLAELLSKNYRVATASDGKEGLTQALALKPDLILSDIMMPQFDGEALLEKIRSAPSLMDTPVVLLTAKADQEMRVKLLQKGAQDYITKPFSSQEVLARIQNLVTLKRARDLLHQEVESQSEDVEFLIGEIAQKHRQLQETLQAMRIARDAAEQSSRLKSDFLNLVSHELRTPLTALHLQLQRLERGQEPPLSEKQQQIIQKINRSANRLLKLLESLLDSAKVESGRLNVVPEKLDIVSLAREIIEEKRVPAEEKGLRLTLVETSVPLLQNDPWCIRLILSNLLENAIKYTETGSVKLSVTASEDTMVFEVSDTGPGIPKKSQMKIFEPFEQLEQMPYKHTPGFGLGLALVRKVVDLIGGTIALSSEQ